jgi:3-deoxy-D-manno-octulosonic-acid transferase
MYWAYRIGLAAFFLAALPVFLLQAILRGKYRRSLPERLGAVPVWTGATPPLWVHAVSVGEVLAALPLVRQVERRWPALPILMSTVTDTGRNVGELRLPGKPFVFFPLDFGWAVSRALGRVRPRAVLLTETELWPIFIQACGRRGIPVVVVNGRISPRSYPRYRRVRRWFGRVLQGVRLFCMQTPDDAARIRELGAPAERVHVVGNLKFDLAGDEDPAEGLRVRAMLGLAPEQPVLVAGSTHKGEEQPVLEAYRRARATFPGLVLLLVPRHPERLDEVAGLLRETGLSWLRRSQAPVSDGTAIILVDSMGELARLYAAGTVVYVGGSLVPVGGHNVLEPAAHGRPVLFGPHMGNFAEMARLFREQGAGLEICDAAGLAAETVRLLGDPDEARRMGEAGRRIVATHRGAAQRTVALLETVL